jgi:predicted ATPase/signal transduction histidine kinase/CheY-like chemotaxis protein
MGPDSARAIRNGGAMTAESYADVVRVRGGRWATIYRAVRTSDHRPVLLEVLDPGHCRIEDAAQLAHELEIGRALDGLAVLAPLALTTFEGRPALELEDSPCASLEALLGAPMAVGAFLDLAVRLSAVVADLHRRGILHKDLKPAHILFDAASGAVQLCSLSLARRVARERTFARPARLIEGSLPYVSPEQTGRVNRVIDSRSDLYALGVVFFQLLTGRLPFEARDVLGWVHCHVARKPPSPRSVVASVPATLSTIVLKLLEKAPEARYQSATGLEHDLRRCQAAWRATGEIAPFPLGQDDVTDHFVIPQRLVGRDRERDALRRAFDRVASSGTSALVLISGAPGIGKSSLVQELQHPIAARGGLFVAGKLEQYRREVPYAGFVDAFRELALDILAESADHVAAWRERIAAAVGASGALVTDLMPAVGRILGPQPAVPDLPPAEAEGRRRRVLRHFIAAFTTPERPLTIFLDDLQWADSATMTLLADLVGDPGLRHVLLVGAYRDGDRDALPPLLHAAPQLRAAGGAVDEIVLGPLAESDVEQLVADVVHTSRDEAAPLAGVIRDRTGGNPFFVGQLLAELHRSDLIRFDAAARRWRWDLAGARAYGCTDDVVDLVVAKLQHLPADTRAALEVAACLGGTFDVDTLALVLERAPVAALQAAVDDDLLVRVDQSYRFVHDRLQEAAYCLTAEGERPALHLRVGRRLLAGTPPEALEERIFDIVNQLDRGSALLATTDEREQLAELDLLAGRRARAAAAHAAALTYFAAGSALLGEDVWERRYELAFDLELHLAECELHTGDAASAELRLAALAARARGLVDQAAVVCRQSAAALVQNQPARGSDLTLAYLRRVGIDWAPGPSEASIRDEYERFRRRLGDRSIEDLVDLPANTDPTVAATLEVLLALVNVATMSDEKLMCLAVARIANLSLEHGCSDVSPLAFVTLAQMLGPYFGDYQAGHRFCTLAMNLLDRRGQHRFRAQSLVIAGAFVLPWTQPLQTSLAVLARAADASREVGEHLYAWCAGSARVTQGFMAGDPLAELHGEAERGVAFARRMTLGMMIDMSISSERLLRTLRGATPRFGCFDDEDFDEGRYEAYLEAEPALVVPAGWYWIRKLAARTLADDTSAALAAAERAQALLWTTGFALERAEYHFYGALALAAGAGTASDEQRRAQLDGHLRALEARAADCADTFAGRAALVAAEIARIDGDAERAARGYEVAIQWGRDRGAWSVVAIAYETAARFYRDRGFALIADTYLREARDAYRRWGADGKVRQLEQRSPALVEPAPRGPAETLVVPSEQLDLLSVVKASQTISSVTDLDQLLTMLLHIVLEQGGARRARLVLVRDDIVDGEPRVAAEAGVDDAMPLLQTAPRVPASIVGYVQRAEVPVVLDDALRDAGRFASDPYFARARPRSVLCLPVRRQGAMIGLLYLENDLAPGVFTPERLLALELLAAQAAVSLEIAHLLTRERAGRERAEAERQRALLLGEATATLSASDHDGVARALHLLCARGLADWALVDTLEAGVVARVACAHRDPGKEPLLRQLCELYPAHVGAATRVLRDSAPYHVPSLSDEQRRASCVDDRHADIVHELGARSFVIVPLIARGTPIGALSLVSATPHHFEPGDLDLAAELGGRVAMALENARLAELEARLRHSQKMEAIGRLAGGVAHDFNNLLCVILSYTHLLSAARHADDPLRGDLDEIRRAGERAAELTRQLLAFSRQQVLEPRALDLNLVVSGVEKMLARLLGADIELALRLAPSLWTTRADPGQLEQVLVNLAVNARDAMPGGGTLTIETRNAELDDDYARSHAGVAPGPHVVLAVVDTGSGMNRDTQARIFEPFFTTKETGKGTGLGLATVLGIVQQSGGHITVDSEPGRGTRFEVFLPRHAGAADVVAAPAPRPVSTSGSETVLLVDDDDGVRAAARIILQRHGYTVLEAGGPGEALLISEQHPGAIHLLLTDIVMPRMTGPELAGRIAAARPGIRLLLMSGYSDASIGEPGLGRQRTAFLQKPLTPDLLTRKVREVLDSGNGSGNGTGRLGRAM